MVVYLTALTVEANLAIVKGVVTENTTLHLGHLKSALPENCFSSNAPQASLGQRMFIMASPLLALANGGAEGGVEVAWCCERGDGGTGGDGSGLRLPRHTEHGGLAPLPAPVVPLFPGHVHS